jgi:hypothetical protein
MAVERVAVVVVVVVAKESENKSKKKSIRIMELAVIGWEKRRMNAEFGRKLAG